MKEAKFLAARHKTVRKANDLIQKSRFDLSLQQQKVLLYIISQIKPSDENFNCLEFSIVDFCRVCGIQESGKNYNALKEAIKEIADKSVWVILPGGTETLFRWIEKAKIYEKSGILSLKLDDDMKPFLLQLKENFTQYELIFTLHFKSKYTIRLYELIKSIHYQELQEYRQQFTVEHLKILLGAEKYKTFQHFKDRVLIPCVREINEYSDKILSYELIKSSRAYTDIVFTMKSKNSIETLRIKDSIDKEMGLLPGQITLWDELLEKGYVKYK